MKGLSEAINKKTNIPRILYQDTAIGLINRLAFLYLYT